MAKLILANFKSNKSLAETQLWFRNFLSVIDYSTLSKLEVSVAPTFITLADSENLVKKSGKNLSLATQDISSFSAGSYSGAISGQNLKGLEVKYSIIGHSERRKRG